jgi:hydrogenase maturation protease
MGVGNTLVSDDGVGIHVVRELKRRIKDPRLEFAESQSGSLDVLEKLTGYRQAVIVDAATTGSAPPGALSMSVFVPASCPGSRVSLHTLGLQTVMPLGTMLGFVLPEKITVFGIEVSDVETFHEGCTPEIETSLPGVTSEIIRFLQGTMPDLQSRTETANHCTYQETLDGSL